MHKKNLKGEKAGKKHLQQPNCQLYLRNENLMDYFP